MKESFYNEYITLERTNWWFCVREKILEILIRRYCIIEPNLTPNILNIGVAGGATSVMLSKFGSIVSTEIHEECRNFVNNTLGLYCVSDSVTQMSFPANTYDFVCAFDVIEHVENDVRAIDEIFRVCKPNGYIVLSVPAYMSLWSDHDVINQHFRRYNHNMVKKLLVNHTCKLVFHTYFNFFLFFPIYLFRKVKNVFYTNKKSEPVSDTSYFKNISILTFLCKTIFSLSSFLNCNKSLQQKPVY